MPKVEITRLGAKSDRNDIGAVGDQVEVSDSLAKALFAYAMAKPVEDKPAEPAAENPADTRETATDNGAETRETRGGDKPAQKPQD